MRGFVNNSFVQASPNGGGMLGRIFGGIADVKRAKTMMDLQMEQHRQREGITTEEIGKRAMVQAAAKDWTTKQDTERHFEFTKKHHALAQDYGLQLSGYRGVSYQRTGNVRPLKTEGEPTSTMTSTGRKKKGRSPNYEETLEAVTSKKIKPVQAAALNEKYNRLHGEAYPKKSKKKNNGVNGGNS